MRYFEILKRIGEAEKQLHPITTGQNVPDDVRTFTQTALDMLGEARDEITTARNEARAAQKQKTPAFVPADPAHPLHPVVGQIMNGASAEPEEEDSDEEFGVISVVGSGGPGMLGYSPSFGSHGG